MSNKGILLKWKNKGKEYEKEIDRQALLDVMSSIAKAFDNDNQISKKLCEIIPVTEWISINKEMNETREIPFIECMVAGKLEIIKIIRHHKIIWSILDGYTR